MKVVAVIVLIAVLVVLIAPVVPLSPAARLVCAGHALQKLLVFLPLTIPRHVPLAGSRQLQRIGVPVKESLSAVPIFTRDCAFLC
jgi:hypothetical protein